MSSRPEACQHASLLDWRKKIKLFEKVQPWGRRHTGGVTTESMLSSIEDDDHNDFADILFGVDAANSSPHSLGGQDSHFSDTATYSCVQELLWVFFLYM